jgi:hypothetical protein
MDDRGAPDHHKPKARLDMKPTGKRLMGLAAALSTIAIAAPASTAAAATVIAPTWITTAPSTYTNTNIQVSATSTSTGPQIA